MNAFIRALMSPLANFCKYLFNAFRICKLKVLIKYHNNDKKQLEYIDQLVDLIKLKAKPILLNLLWNPNCQYQEHIIDQLDELSAPEARRLKRISHGSIPETQEFRKLLREQIAAHKDRRSKYILQKIGFTIAFFTVSIFKIIPTEKSSMPSVDSPHSFIWLLCVLPIIAISYDVFIYAEDYEIRRIGTFLRTCMKNVSQCEWHWELFVHTHNEPWAVRFNYLITLLTLLPALKYKLFSILQNSFTLIFFTFHI